MKNMNPYKSDRTQGTYEAIEGEWQREHAPSKNKLGLTDILIMPAIVGAISVGIWGLKKADDNYKIQHPKVEVIRR